MKMSPKLEHTVDAPWMCSGCGYMMDACAPLEGENVAPETGDVSLCMNCGRVYWREGRSWRPITEVERASLEPESRRELTLAEFHRGRVIKEDLAAKPGRA